MTWGTGHAGRVGCGARALAVGVGLDAGLGWVPADGVSPQLAALAITVSAAVVLTGLAARRGRGLDGPSVRALGLAALASAGAVLAPPDFAPRPAPAGWLVLAVLAAVLALAARPRGTAAHTRPRRVAVTGPRPRS